MIYLLSEYSNIYKGFFQNNNNNKVWIQFFFCNDLCFMRGKFPLNKPLTGMLVVLLGLRGSNTISCGSF
jgi:hypothetical protein